MATELEQMLADSIRTIPDYPKEGIIFRDITPLLKDKAAFSKCIDEMVRRLGGKKIDYIVGIESRGFLIGAPIAYGLNVGLIPIRKKGKLPYKTVSREYSLEYGSATIEMHEDAIKKGDNVVIVDDLLATGGTAKAAAELIESLGGKIASMIFVIELSGLGGKDKLSGYDLVSILKY